MKTILQQAVEALGAKNLTAKHLCHADGATYDAWVKKLHGNRRLTLVDLLTIACLTRQQIVIHPDDPEVLSFGEGLLRGEPAATLPPERPAGCDARRNYEVYVAYRWGTSSTAAIAEMFEISTQRVRQIAAAERLREEPQETP